jgi:hypothetical protein
MRNEQESEMETITQNTPFTIDARAWAMKFENMPDDMPRVVFGLLRHYFDNGPFEFDAKRISDVLSAANVRLYPAQVAELQPQIESFFETTPAGLQPRREIAN